MPRKAVIVPGSSSWWLLTLSPIMYFDRVRVPEEDLQEVRNQENMSFFHFSVSRVLAALEQVSDEPILIPDKRLAGRGESPAILREAKRLSKNLVEEAERWRPSSPTTIRPSELKKAMLAAYREWIRYNTKKAAILPANDPYRRELAEKQVPRSKQSLARLKATHARDLPHLLTTDRQFSTVFLNLVRNAHLATTVAESPAERTYDVLAREFLPTIELVEWYKVFAELPQRHPELRRFDVLVRLYDVRMTHIRRASRLRPPGPENIVATALKERKRFKDLRKRLAEIDLWVRDNPDADTRSLREIIQLAQDLHKQIERLDIAGAFAVWSSGAYFLTEMMSTLEPGIAGIVTRLLVNPFTTAVAKESLKNLFLASKGLRGAASVAIASVRDYMGTGSLRRGGGPRLFGPGVFEFWV